MLLPDTPLFVVINHASGSRDAHASVVRMREILSQAGRRHTFFPVTEPKRLREIAARAVDAASAAAGAVVVAGGDGTINCVAARALEAGRPFGIVSHGTFNYSSRAHGIPLEPEAATHALLDAELKAVQVGVVNDRIFLVNASLGLYPQLLEDREAFKRRYGRNRMVALWSALHTLARPKPELSLDVEHDQTRERVKASTLFVGNNPLQLAQVGLPEAEIIGQRRLGAVMIPPIGAAALFWLGVRGAVGRLGDAESVRDFSFARMVVAPARGRTGRRLKVATDGEITWMQGPLRFSVAPKMLQLMVPRAAPHEVAKAG